MNRTAQFLTLAVASVVAGCGTAPRSPDAGPLVDAGIHYTRLSGGTAILSGAFTGTQDMVAFAFSAPTGFQLLDGGNSGPYVYFQVSNAVPYISGPQFGCTFDLFFSQTLDAGVYIPSNVSELQCIAEKLPDGGSDPEFWGNFGEDFGPPSTFDLILTSPGPVDVFVSAEGEDWYDWNDPSGSVYVYIAPGPGQIEGFGFSVTFAPPPCPTYCAPNTP